jgi:hypothetical protein
MSLKRRKSIKRPTATADQKFLNRHKKAGLQQQLSIKGCKVLDGKHQKNAEIN